MKRTIIIPRWLTRLLRPFNVTGVIAQQEIEAANQFARRQSLLDWCTLGERIRHLQVEITTHLDNVDPRRVTTHAVRAAHVQMLLCQAQNAAKTIGIDEHRRSL